MKRVIQIACNPQLHALCEDGTIWQHVSPQGWRQVEPIPEPEDPIERAARNIAKDPISKAARTNPLQNPTQDNAFPAQVVKVTEPTS